MYIGHIAGFAFLPVSIILFLNTFGYTNITSIFGLGIMILAAIGLIAIQIGDIIDSHIKGEFVLLYWGAGVVLCLPSLIFFASKAVAFPPAILNSLPLIMASFLFTEGLSSLFIHG